MKKRLPDPLAAVIPETVPKPKPAASADKGEAVIRRRMAAGRGHNYYEAAGGELVQKVPVYFPAAQVIELKTIAAQERRTLSALVREAVDDYLKKTGRRG